MEQFNNSIFEALAYLQGLVLIPRDDDTPFVPPVDPPVDPPVEPPVEPGNEYFYATGKVGVDGAEEKEYLHFEPTSAGNATVYINVYSSKPIASLATVYQNNYNETATWAPSSNDFTAGNVKVNVTSASVNRVYRFVATFTDGTTETCYLWFKRPEESENPSTEPENPGTEPENPSTPGGYEYVYPDSYEDNPEHGYFYATGKYYNESEQREFVYFTPTSNTRQVAIKLYSSEAPLTIQVHYQNNYNPTASWAQSSWSSETGLSINLTSTSSSINRVYRFTATFADGVTKVCYLWFKRPVSVDLTGKHIAMFGDSIFTSQSGEPGVAALLTSAGATVTNFAQGGTTIAIHDDTSILHKLKNTDLSAYNTVIIEGGINDCYNTAIGTETSTDEETFVGAIRKIDNIAEQNPNIKFIVCIPPQTRNAWSNRLSEADIVSQYNAYNRTAKCNNRWILYQAYRNHITHATLCDLTDVNSGDIEPTLYKDSLHPNTEGVKRIYDKIVEYVKDGV